MREYFEAILPQLVLRDRLELPSRELVYGVGRMMADKRNKVPQIPKDRIKSRAAARPTRREIEAAELLDLLPEPVPPRDFWNWLKETITALRVSSDEEALFAKLGRELFKNAFMRDLLTNHLTKWLILRSEDPGFKDRAERWKNQASLDSEGLREFLEYLVARSDRARERFSKESEKI
jgi:hypothetical protein